MLFLGISWYLPYDLNADLLIFTSVSLLRCVYLADYILGCKPFQEKKLKSRFWPHLIQFFLPIPNMVSKIHKMHLNPIYDQKTGLGQPTQFWKKI